MSVGGYLKQLLPVTIWSHCKLQINLDISSGAVSQYELQAARADLLDNLMPRRDTEIPNIKPTAIPNETKTILFI